MIIVMIVMIILYQWYYWSVHGLTNKLIRIRNLETAIMRVIYHDCNTPH